MAVRGPLVTAVLVLGGLVGFMTVNSVGGLVVASEDTAQPPATTTTGTPPETTTPETTRAVPEPTERPEPPPAFPDEAGYAGTVGQGPMTIAVAVAGERAVGYLCDGAAVESWLTGTAVDGRLDLRSRDGAARVVATLDGAALTGTVTLTGQRLAFTVEPAAAPAGLYRGTGGDTTVGWIVLADGTQVGIATTAGRSEPAPRLDPAAGQATVNGTRVTATRLAGDTPF